MTNQSPDREKLRDYWEIEFSRQLQSLEGMEIISPKLRVDIEKLCLGYIKSESSRQVATALEEVKTFALEVSPDCPTEWDEMLKQMAHRLAK